MNFYLKKFTDLSICNFLITHHKYLTKIDTEKSTSNSCQVNRNHIVFTIHHFPIDFEPNGIPFDSKLIN